MGLVMHKLLKEALSQELLRSKAQESFKDTHQVLIMHSYHPIEKGYQDDNTEYKHKFLNHRISVDHASGNWYYHDPLDHSKYIKKGYHHMDLSDHLNNLQHHDKRESVTEMDDSEAGPVSGDGKCLQCGQDQVLLDENGKCSLCCGKKESFTLGIKSNHGKSLLENNEEPSIGNLMKVYTLSKDKLHPHAVYINLENDKVDVKFEFLDKTLYAFHYPIVFESTSSHLLHIMSELHLALRFLDINHDPDDILESLRNDNKCIVLNDKPIPKVSVVDQVMGETAKLNKALIGHTVELHYSDRNYNSIKKTFKSKEHAKEFIAKDDKDKYGNIRHVHGIRNLEPHEMHPKTSSEVSGRAPRP